MEIRRRYAPTEIGAWDTALSRESAVALRERRDFLSSVVTRRRSPSPTRTTTTTTFDLSVILIVVLSGDGDV
jgi:hypothetical protein